jgi:hypothetical protein
MTKTFQDLAAKDTPPADLVQQMAMLGHAKRGLDKSAPPRDSSGFSTIMAADMAKVGSLKGAINTLVVRLRAALPTEQKAIVEAYDATSNAVEPLEWMGMNMADLWRFTTEIQSRVRDPGVQQAVAELREAHQAFVIHERDAMGSAMGGLSILLPPREDIARAMSEERYPTLRFARDTGWGGFLTTIASMPRPPVAPRAH